MTNEQLLLEIEKMKTEINVWKKIGAWLAGFAALLAVAALGWTIALADSYAQLRQNVGIHEERLKRIESIQSTIQERVTKTHGDVRVIEANTKNIQDSVEDLKNMMKAALARQIEMNKALKNGAHK